MGIWHSTTTTPINETVGAKAIRHALETNADAEVLVAAINDAMARIDRGLHDHLYHPRKADKALNTLLDMTSGLRDSLQETRKRLEEGLRKLDERRGVVDHDDQQGPMESCGR
jgi:hypothetical protein